MTRKPFIDELSDLFDSDVIRGILALIMVISTVVMANKGNLTDTFMVLTVAVVTFYFGQKNGIHQERVQALTGYPAQCPFVNPEVELEEVNNA